MLDVDYSTFVLLPGTKNPAVGMMMQTTPGGATVVLDEHLAELESFSRGESTSPRFSSQPSTPPSRPMEEVPPCRNGANCTIPMCTFSHPTVSHFPNRSRFSFSSAPFVPSFSASPASSPVKQRYDNKYYDNRVSETKHFDMFTTPMASRTPSSSQSSVSSSSPERSPELQSRSLGRRVVPVRKGQFDGTFSTQNLVEGYGEFSRHQAPIVLYANAN